MKKFIAMACCALAFAFGASASETQYKVYDVTMSLKTTKAGGKVTTSCGDDYTWRKKASRKVRGVITGCGCSTAAADTSDGIVAYFWDVTTKTQLTNFTYTTQLIQRVGKKGEQVEQFVLFTVTEPDGERFELQLAGMGTYSASRKDSEADTMSVSGTVTGVMDAPMNVTPGYCNACETVPDTVDQTQAAAICLSGTCDVSDNSDTTVVFGTYTFKHNSKKAKKCEREGVSKDSLDLPSYVEL